MTPATYYLETFGCQMNVLDSELVEGQLRRLGLTPVDSPAAADLILFNTCSVRQHAEDKVLSRLGNLRSVKRRRPQTTIGVIGCMAQRRGEAWLAEVPQVDLLCAPGELYRLPELLAEIWAGRRKVAALTTSQSRRTDAADRDDDGLEALDLARQPLVAGSVLQSYVRVQRGCDKFCTYCVVPFTRGPQRSRPPGNIVEEVRRLAGQGCREVTLLGQTVNSYASREDGRVVRFAELLRRVHAVEGIDRIRFVTSYPAEWDEEIFRIMRDHPRVCPYLHLPAQSGSDRILKAMKRGYTVADYLRVIDAARRLVPTIGLAGDFITGFCGETDEDHQATIRLIERVDYQGLFIFKYSPRPGTPADRAQVDDVPEEVKAARNNELLAIQGEIGRRQKQAMVGQMVEVLVEGYSKAARRAQENADEDVAAGSGSSSVPSDSATIARQLTGRTPQGMIAVFDGDAGRIGSMVRVKVESASPLTLMGRIAGCGS